MQSFEEFKCLRCKVSATGSILWITLHQKCWIFGGAESFQIFFHICCLGLLSLDWLFSVMSWWFPELTEYLPSLVKIQTGESLEGNRLRCIFLTSWISWVCMCRSNWESSHPVPVWFLSSEILYWWFGGYKEGRAGLGGLSIYGSCQILIVWPSPTLHFKPCLINCVAWKILLHAWQGLWPKVASSKDAFGKYFALNTCARREFGSLTSSSFVWLAEQCWTCWYP